jgi:hypothetical protein
MGLARTGPAAAKGPAGKAVRLFMGASYLPGKIGAHYLHLMDEAARMPFDAPLQLGPFSVRPDGRLALVEPGRPPSFRMQWRGCRVEARLRANGPDGELGELSLHATVGRVPSTARLGAGAAQGREAVFAALRSLPPALPQGWRTDLTADHSVALLRACRVEMPTTVTSLLTDVTLFLLALRPYLDLLAEAGVEPPEAAGAPGMVKT